MTPMTSEGSVTRWITLLKDGDRAAAQPLWEAYFRRLVALARARLRDAPRRARDEEDIALSAFDSFCRRAEAGQFPQLADRNDLWQILFVLTVRKTIDALRREGRQVRGGGRVRSLADLADSGVDQFLDPEPSPELAAQMADECRRLLDCLDDETLRVVALGKMQGETNAEIAAQPGCVEQTVVRKLRRIRGLWTQETER
jgi:DNA-directed RNA polymerase specialized sigma24 family protein